MRHRQVVALLAMLGLLLSVYLTLYKMGLTGPIQCGAGEACERVQLGRYGELFGIPVAAYGVGGYLAILVAAIVGLQPKWERRPEPTTWIVVLAAGGVAFTAYLKYLELFRIHAICPWCVGSAVIITAILVVALIGKRQVMRDG